MKVKRALVVMVKVVVFPVTIALLLSQRRRRRAQPRRPPLGPPGTGVREPRNPKPFAGAGAIALPERAE